MALPATAPLHHWLAHHPHSAVRLVSVFLSFVFLYKCYGSPACAPAVFHLLTPSLFPGSPPFSFRSPLSLRSPSLFAFLVFLPFFSFPPFSPRSPFSSPNPSTPFPLSPPNLFLPFTALRQVEIGNAAKAVGNKYFKEKDFAKASKFYGKAIRYLDEDATDGSPADMVITLHDAAPAARPGIFHSLCPAPFGLQSNLVSRAIGMRRVTASW